MLLSEIFEHLQPRRWLAISFIPTSPTTRPRGSAKRHPDKTVDVYKAGEKVTTVVVILLFICLTCISVPSARTLKMGGSSSRTMT